MERKELKPQQLAAMSNGTKPKWNKTEGGFNGSKFSRFGGAVGREAQLVAPPQRLINLFCGPD